jgi:nucleotide-binding universal stress UspA family protein
MAAEEARLRNARLNVVHQLVGPEAPYRFGRDSDFRSAEQDAAQAIRAVLTEVEPSMRDYELDLVTSPAADELVRLSRRADLVVLGVTASHPTTAAMFGAVSYQVVGRVHCPVMLVPAHIRHSPRQLICGVDRTDASAVALRWAAADAALRGLTLLAIEGVSHQQSCTAGGDHLTRWVRTVRPKAETTILCSREHGRHPERLLLELAQRRQALLVVGRHDSDSHLWSRSVSRHISAQTLVPAVIVPHPVVKQRSTVTADLRLLAAT